MLATLMEAKGWQTHWMSKPQGDCDYYLCTAVEVAQLWRIIRADKPFAVNVMRVQEAKVVEVHRD